MSFVVSCEEIDSQTKVIRIIWTISDFIKVLNGNVRELRTDKSNLRNVDPAHMQFQMKVQFLGRDNDLIEIYYLSKKPQFLKCSLQLRLKSYETKTIVTKDYSTVAVNKWQHLITLYKRDIVGYEGKLLHLNTDGNLVLIFEFLTATAIKINEAPDSGIYNDLENLLSTGSFSDVTIKSVNNVEFAAHKAILASRSAVFKAHFEHNTTECYTNIIESPFEQDILQEVLYFIYTDLAPKVDEIPEKLLAAADYYQLHKLKVICERAIHQKLTVDNAIEILQLADLHYAHNLIQSTFEFIKDGQTKLITETEGWKNIQSVDLVKRLYKYMVNDGETDIK